MHTLARNGEINARLIEFFLRKAYNSQPSIKNLSDDNIINGTQLSELAVSRLSGIPMCEVGEHRDLIDNSDVKTATVQESTYRQKLKSGKKKEYTRYFADIKGIDTKIGLLRCIVYNPHSETWHYFLIPPSAYLGNKVMKISFDKETQKPIGIYAKYEKSSFEAICRKKNIREEFDEVICSAAREGDIDKNIEKALMLYKHGTIEYEKTL